MTSESVNPLLHAGTVKGDENGVRWAFACVGVSAPECGARSGSGTVDAILK